MFVYPSHSDIILLALFIGVLSVYLADTLNNLHHSLKDGRLSGYVLLTFIVFNFRVGNKTTH